MSPHVQRLTESQAPVAPQPLPVIVDSRPVEYWRCPHCKQEIYEKHTYHEDGVDYHSDCKNPIKFPPTDWSKIDPQWRALLMTLLILVLFSVGLAAAVDPKLNIEHRGTNVVVWLTGGVSNQQYWVETNNDYRPDSTNYYEWRRFYSSDFHTNTVFPVYDPSAPTNTAAGKPMRFFKLGDPLLP